MMMLVLAACLPLTADRDRITAADFSATDAVFSALPPETPFGYAPSAGVKRTFGVAELTRLARRNNIPFEPQGEICFERPVEPLDSDAVVEAMRSSLGLPDARIEIVEQSLYPVPRGTLEFPRAGLVPPAPSQPQAAAMWKGSIRYGGNRRCAIWARVRIVTRMDRVVAAEALHAGHTIEAVQLKLETYEGFPLRARPLHDFTEAVGRMPKRSLAAGATLTAADLESAYDVKRGDSVRVAVSSGEAHLELDGRAESSGRRGQTISVTNPVSGKKFPARVEGAGRVEVETYP
jgi:flagella basal body P-ring formation protein FlgA